MTPAGPTAPWSVRPLRADDVGDLRRIADSAFACDPGDGAALVDLFAGRLHDRPAVALVAGGRDGIAGFAFGSHYTQRGFVDMLAVDPGVRGRGVGTALLAHLEGALVDAGAGSVALGGNGHFYAWPGVDVRYSHALALADRRGYRRSGEAHNMDVDLRDWRPGTGQQVLARHGNVVQARRATAADWHALSAFVAREFSEGWRDEVGLALRRSVPTVFVAVRGDQIVGFACHGVYRAGWFGPIGTATTERGGGIGEALLRVCLDDLAHGGIQLAQIAWVGPTGFYSRTVNARVGRQFVILSKDAEPVAPTRARRAATPVERTPGG